MTLTQPTALTASAAVSMTLDCFGDTDGSVDLDMIMGLDKIEYQDFCLNKAYYCINTTMAPSSRARTTAYKSSSLSFAEEFATHKGSSKNGVTRQFTNLASSRLARAVAAGSLSP